MFLDLWWVYILINPSYVENILSQNAFTTPNLLNIIASLADLKCAQNIYVSLELGKIISLSLPSITREYLSYGISLAREEIKIQNFKYGFY